MVTHVVVVVAAFISLVGGIIAVVDVDDTVDFVFANVGVLEFLLVLLMRTLLLVLLLLLLLMSIFTLTLVLFKYFLICSIYHFRNSSLYHL